MAFTKITIEAEIKAPIEKTWAAYTDPEHITKWNFASEDWHCPSAENDLKIGGKFKSRMEAKDGSFGFDFEGIYDEIILHKKLVYHLEDQRSVSITFLPENGSTKMSIIFDAENENPIEMQQDGWQAILNNFKKHAETIS